MSDKKWPTKFPKAIIGLDRDGVINEDIGTYIKTPNQWKAIPGSLEAIKKLRLRGHKVCILTNQGGIKKGVLKMEEVDRVNEHMMREFGAAGIRSISGLYYSDSSNQKDYFAKPNIGMFMRAEFELFGGEARFESGGYYVGDKITDLWAAVRARAIPVLVRTGYGKKTEGKLKQPQNAEVLEKTIIFDTLEDFVESIT